MAIVTLSSDIGQQDFIVGAIKGQLLSINHQFNIVDLTHYLAQTNYPQAAYTCSNTFKYFPEFTFHIVLLNCFHLPKNKFLIAKHNNQYIICPDNGILTMITKQKPSQINAIDITKANTLLDITLQIGKTINSIFTQKNFIIQEEKPLDIVEKYPLRAMISDTWMEGQILYIDNFENVVVNITREEFEECRNGRNFKIVFTRQETIDTISKNYSTAVEGEKLAWFNSAGYLEIAINKGNIAGLFGLQGFNEKMQQQGLVSQNKWFYQTVKIFFE